mmetsp:Transcript_41213/g.76175  ORF Transcript_41213/g.76175 Transcript_41213/m.76175 type:complete len:191 (-) Transcript_41213:100-672(-)|eukprot:CAMPEP_0197454476 /NCGR_PEP_ID=MMETSP1175-20131217/38059_1 /TAXON_ID=1003142 /ORGANISM="Triceratium dubium, Strain CCMP147" /LENGTH=190 /DNA_ID=CAMNT_0042988065 /DNA_START=38 /DNA_END=610 /DNA_ORIENTATION=-
MKTSMRVLIAAAAIGAAGAFQVTMSASEPSSSVAATKDRRAFLQTAGAAGTAAVAAFGGPSRPVLAEDTSDPYSDYTTTESGLRYKVVTEGSGAVPSAGQTVKTQYTGWLDGFDSPKKFDSSRDRGRPFSFRVGAGQVIRGWDEAFSTMKVGERRKIILPPRLGYGDRGAGGIIPGGATLYFDVELLGIL